MAKKPVMLCILDGFGWVPDQTYGNAIVAAKKPNLDRLFAQRGLQLYVPETFGHCVAHGRVILSSALSGGSLAQRLEEWGRRGIVTARAAREAVEVLGRRSGKTDR